MSARRACHAGAQAGYRGFTARLCLDWAAGEIHQHAKRLDHRALAHGGTADGAKAMLAVNDASVARGGGEVDEANRLARRGTARAGNAGDGDRKIDAGT